MDFWNEFVSAIAVEMYLSRRRGEISTLEVALADFGYELPNGWWEVFADPIVAIKLVKLLIQQAIWKHVKEVTFDE